MTRPGSSLVAAVVALSGSIELAAFQASEPAASAKVWVGRAGEYEDFLKNAAVVRSEDIPVGVTKPVRCYFAPGGLLESFAFKSVKPGYQTGYWESYRSACVPAGTVLAVPPAIGSTSHLSFSRTNPSEWSSREKPTPLCPKP